MEASDDICYGLLDLLDAIELKVIRLEDIKDIFTLLCEEKTFKDIYNNENYSDIIKIEKLVADAINNLAKHTMEVFETNFDVIVNDKQSENDLLKLFTNSTLKEGINKAKKFAQNKIFHEKRKIELELGAYNIIETLLYSFILATHELYEIKDEKKLSFRNKRALALMGEDKPELKDNLYVMYQRVIDYIVGMTDNHAQYIAGQLNGGIRG